MKKNLSTPLIYLVLLVVIIALVSGFDPRGNTAEEVSYNDFIQLVRDEKVSYVDITDLQLVGLYVDSELSEETFPAKYDFYTYIPSLEAYREDMTILTEELKGIPRDQVTNADFPVESMANPTPKPSIWEGLLPYVLMIGALAVLYYFMFRSQGGGNSVMNFGKSRARTQMDPGKKVTFADVAGADEEKEELREVVEFMRSPKRFTEMGARIPKGVLLVGPPPAKPCWPRRWPGKPAHPSSPFRVPTLWRCSWAWAPAGCGICSAPPRNAHLPWYSSMRLTRWAASGAQA